MSGKIINMTPYKDPDEFIGTEGAEAFEKRLAEAENSFFFELRILQRNYDLNDPESKTRFTGNRQKALRLFRGSGEGKLYRGGGSAVSHRL